MRFLILAFSLSWAFDSKPGRLYRPDPQNRVIGWEALIRLMFSPSRRCISAT